MRLLLLAVPPKIVPFHFGEEPSNFGESTSVQCSVIAGDFPIDIMWLLNGEPIIDDTISIGRPSKRMMYLNIDSVNGHHAGNYTCRASNVAGSAEQIDRLIVNGIWKE